MAMNEPVNCPNCATENDAMPDDKKTQYQNTPTPDGGTIDMLPQVRVVGFVCSNCGQKITYQRLPPVDEIIEADTLPR
jgi:predicted RNA-binding Zn-ribbon protein involved in translation (DUF1610 family)